MDERTLQTPNIKTNSEFVDKATELITKITEQIDKCCPDCQALLKSGLVNDNQHQDDTVTISRSHQETGMSKLERAVHKDNSPITADVNQELKLLWLADITRPWDTYSPEQSRPSYDFGIHRSYSDLEEAKK